jgi:hypothetical protein
MRSVFTGTKKCGGAKMHKGRSPSPEGAKRLPYVKRHTINTPLSYYVGTFYTKRANMVRMRADYYIFIFKTGSFPRMIPTAPKKEIGISGVILLSLKYI